jgi:hypothetical protein
MKIDMGMDSSASASVHHRLCQFKTALFSGVAKLFGKILRWRMDLMIDGEESLSRYFLSIFPYRCTF